jgi:hypothetical protein
VSISEPDADWNSVKRSLIQCSPHFPRVIDAGLALAGYRPDGIMEGIKESSFLHRCVAEQAEARPQGNRNLDVDRKGSKGTAPL